jgi:hypothetical protein
MTTTLSLKRDSGFADRLRDYRVLLDGREIGRIGNGEDKDFAVTSGHHQLVVKIDWCRSNIVTFDIAEDQSAKFICGSSLTGTRRAFAIFYVFFAPWKYLWLRAG